MHLLRRLQRKTIVIFSISCVVAVGWHGYQFHMRHPVVAPHWHRLASAALKTIGFRENVARLGLMASTLGLVASRERT